MKFWLIVDSLWRVDMYKAAVLTISDRCSRGEREDISGKVIQELIRGISFELVQYEVIPDEAELIKKKLIDYSDNLKADLILTTGGTGFSPRDVTPEATKAVLDKEVPGIPEVIRLESLKFSRRAMLSRAICGLRGRTLIINLPGSAKAVRESLGIILDTLVHAIDMIYGKDH